MLDSIRVHGAVRARVEGPGQRVDLVEHRAELPAHTDRRAVIGRFRDVVKLTLASSRPHKRLQARPTKQARSATACGGPWPEGHVGIATYFQAASPLAGRSFPAVRH